MGRDDERGRERAADELQREIDREVEGEMPPPAHPSLRDLFRERMFPPPDGDAAGEEKPDGG